jgi:transcriptional regulator GlxA family with amidase domain
MDRRVQKVINYMETNLSHRLPLEEVARSVNLSPSHLRCLFRAETGMAPVHYLKYLRMRRAKSLVEDTFLNVKQIMDKLGIRDESHFVRDFKRVYGLTPGQYRVRCGDGNLGAENGDNRKSAGGD